MTCCTLQTMPTQTMFLGCSIVSYSASMGWEQTQSEISIELVESACSEPKLFYTTCLTVTSGNYSDLGFFGEDRYLRSNGTYYSSCIKEDVSDTKVRDAISLCGLPVYIRIGDFEFSGIISDWTRTNSTTAPTYRVKVVDPRILLEGVMLIIDGLTAGINGVVSVLDGGTGEPQTNLFNIYGYLEQFGLICPSYSQCAPGVYNTTATCPTAVDGPVFGSLVGGYGGALVNNNGIPYNYLITGFNFLANATPAITNAWSPYGRVSFFAEDISAIGTSGCGLIEQDSGASYFANKNYYFVDLTELPAFPDNSYRISGTSISLLDLISKVSQDLNFDFYFELLPVRDVSTIFSSNCVTKIIKLRTVARTNQPSLDKICEFIQDADCIVESSIGQELRNETVSKFLIGGKKRSIYQVATVSNPDGGSTSEITSLDSYLGALRTDAGCSEIDDTIVPYFGTDYDGNFIVPCKVSGIWEFEAPVWGIQGELQEISFSGSTITINENEIRAALKGYVSWEGYCAAANTDSWQTIYQSGTFPLIDIAEGAAAVASGKTLLSHDLSNPKLGKFRSNIDSVRAARQEDKEAIHNWVRSYGEYYGKKFAVRVPFTCVKVDSDSLQPIVSERPTNDGGWTEETEVLGLPNGGPLSLGVYEYLNFFRDEENKISPFVRFTDAVLLTVGGLSKEDYLYRYSILSGSAASGSGPPSGVPGGSICYQDTLTDIIYVYYIDQWLPINQSCVLHGSGFPSITGVQSTADFCPVYYDNIDGDVYIAGDTTYSGATGVNINSWNITASLDLYVKAQVEEEYVYHDKSNYFAPRVVIEIPDSVRLVEPDPTYIAGLQKAGEAVGSPSGLDKTLTHNVGGDSSFLHFDYRAGMIYSAAIPLEHNTLTYGPWYNPTITGRVEIINESNLVPWRYNGYAGLNLAANNLANESRVNMYRGELGSITVPGYPTIPLGAELTAINDGYYTSGEHLIENRTPSSGSVSGVDYNSNLVSSSYARFMFSAAWTGTHGPNVTDISIAGDANGFRTTYNMRTFAPRRGFFERYRAQRIEAMSVRANKVVDILREEESARKRRALFQGKGRRQSKREEHDLKQRDKSAQLLSGQEIASGSGGGDRRTAVANMPMSQGSYEVQNNYATKAFMSLDGLLRPMSMDGDGGLSPFVFYTGTSGILQDDLNPFTNPSGYDRSRVATVRNDAVNVGHDFEVLGRSGADTTGLINAVGSGNTQYANDYRPMALRGPLIVKGWGYDTDGYPVPNKVDTEQFAASGIFESSGLDATKFLSGHLQKPHTWVVAPVDLRLDRDRGVWVAGNSNATPDSTTRDEIVLISVTGERDVSCCLYKGFMRPATINPSNPCEISMQYEEVYVFHHCDILTPPDCIMAKYLTATTGTSCGSSGTIYQFLSVAMPDTEPTPCDCCCPANQEGIIASGTIESSCATKNFIFNYMSGIETHPDLVSCTGGEYLTNVGFTVPYNGWLSEPIYCTVDYPVILSAVTLDLGSGPDSPYYFRTDYSSWEHTATYYDDGGTLLPMTSGYTFVSGLGTERILTDGDNNIVYESLTLKYRIAFKCPLNDRAIDSAEPVIMHLTPSGYPASGVIEDHQLISKNPFEACAFNSEWFHFDVDFGTNSCEITINESGGGGTYTLNPWKLHWYCMCPCSGAGDRFDLDPAALNNDCSVPNARLRIDW